MTAPLPLSDRHVTASTQRRALQGTVVCSASNTFSPNRSYRYTPRTLTDLTAYPSAPKRNCSVLGTRWPLNGRVAPAIRWYYPQVGNVQRIEIAGSLKLPGRQVPLPSRPPMNCFIVDTIERVGEHLVPTYVCDKPCI